MKNNNLELKSTLEELKNIDKPLPKSADIFKKITFQTSEVVRASLREWQNAYEFAKDVDQPDRLELLEIYEKIEIDTHITSISETIFNGIGAMDF